MNRSVALIRIVNWVNKAYPEGVPTEDRGPLATLLSSYLSGDQVVELLGGPVPRGSYEADVPRVAARLVAVGWPLGDPAATEEETAGPIGRAVGSVVQWLRSGMRGAYLGPSYAQADIERVTEHLRRKGWPVELED